MAAGGAVVGDNIGFWIGVTGGYRLARRYGPKVRLDERKLKVARYLFELHGAKLVSSAVRLRAAHLRGVPGRDDQDAVAALPGGQRRRGDLWAGVYTAAGVFGGGAPQRLSMTIDLVLGGIAALAIVPERRRCGACGGAERARRAGVPGPLEPG